nr:hypothetical protein [Tanacetum cinerariifolium]
MLRAAKVPLFFWAEVITTACFTQNHSLVIPRHEKTPYHISNDQKPPVKFFHIFGSICYIVRDAENLDKMKEKGDECIFVGYSTQSRAYRVFNKRTRVIMESIHVNFDKLPQMVSDHVSSDPDLECQSMALEQDTLSPAIQHQENVPQVDTIVTTSNELDLLFSLMFDELLNGSSKVVSKSFAVCSADAPNHRQQHTTPLNTHTTPAPTCQVPHHAPTVTSSENINQAEMYAENDQVADDEFINILCTLIQDQRETSSHHVDSPNMHTFYRRYPSELYWTKDHPLEQVIGNPSQSVRTRRQLESDAEMCMFMLTRVVTCFECEVHGHYKKDCPKLKNHNRGNQAGNGGGQARTYAVGNAKKYLDSNVITDEAIHKELGDRLVRAATTTSSLEAEWDNGEEIDDIDQDEDITLVNDQDDAEMFDVDDLHVEDISVKLIVDVAHVNTAGEVNAASIAIANSVAATITTDEITLDKGKAIMIEEPLKPKKKDQIRLKEETAKRLQAEFDKEQRIAQQRESSKGRRSQYCIN